MGRDVSLDIRLRPLDAKRFVGDFVRKFSAWIPEGSPVRTTRDVLRCALADLDWENDVYSHFETSDPTDSAPAGRPNTDAEKKGYDAVVSVIERTVGAKWFEYLAMVG